MTKWDTLSRINGLYVGMLDKYELDIFEAACRSYEARRSYDHPGGALGLAKVEVVSRSPQENDHG